MDADVAFCDVQVKVIVPPPTERACGAAVNVPVSVLVGDIPFPETATFCTVAPPPLFDMLPL